MPIEAKVIADSVAPNGVRLTTVQYRAPRFILAEINTHRAFSRNARSSRAVPVKRIIEEVKNDPFIPLYWGKNQPGMQAREELDESARDDCHYYWLLARDCAVGCAKNMAKLGAHKQVINRLLEPFMWVDGLITATDWDNFFELRCHPDAEPHMRVLAEAIREAIAASEPVDLVEGDWHLPYVDDVDATGISSLEDVLFLQPWEIACLLSARRCARVSYKPFDPSERDVFSEIAKAEAMATATPLHASPFEHQATPLLNATDRCCNFRGWRQLRSILKARA